MKAFNRLMKIVGAWGFLTILDFCYDDLLYPAMIWIYGSLLGGGIMTLGSICICFAFIYGYERSGKDWLGVNVVEQVKKDGNEWVWKLHAKASVSNLWYVLRMILYPFSQTFLVVLWALKKNDFAAFIALSIFKDPFITTIFLRHGRFDGLGKRDWCVFMGSVLLSNGYWILRNTVIITGLKYGIHHMFN